LKLHFDPNQQFQHDAKCAYRYIGCKTAKGNVTTLDRLFNDNDQLKTNTALQMKDAGIEFKVV